jgi:hypothetical protein
MFAHGPASGGIGFFFWRVLGALPTWPMRYSKSLDVSTWL